MGLWRQRLQLVLLGIECSRHDHISRLLYAFVRWLFERRSGGGGINNFQLDLGEAGSQHADLFGGSRG